MRVASYEIVEHGSALSMSIVALATRLMVSDAPSIACMYVYISADPERDLEGVWGVLCFSCPPLWFPPAGQLGCNGGRGEGAKRFTSVLAA